MKQCVNCGNYAEDNESFCKSCGASFAPGNNVNGFYQQGNGNQFNTVNLNIDDKTSQFNPNDIAENKIYAITAYLGVMLIIAVIMGKDSPFVKFHIKQALKLYICGLFSCVFLIIPLLGWVVFGVLEFVLFIVEIIAIVNACKGKAKELPIIKGIDFLK